MSIQWTFIAGYLYFEIVVVFLMIAPLFSPRRWYQFFNSRLFSIIKQHAAVYFYGLLGILCLFLIDAIKEMRKYSHATDAGAVHFATEMKSSVKLFRAQRNFYITGFAIFLAFVIRRLITMLIIQHELTSKAARIIKDAEATVNLARNTVLANAMQTGDAQDVFKDELEVTKTLLDEEKLRVKQFEEEASKWRLKYEELAEKVSGKGDE